MKTIRVNRNKPVCRGVVFFFFSIFTVFYSNGQAFIEVPRLETLFPTPIDYLVQSSPVLVDLDGDNDLDAVIGEAYGTFRYFENIGGKYSEITGANNPFNDFTTGVNSMPTFADIDGDLDLDLISGEFYGRFFYYRNDNGVFTELTEVSNPFDGIKTTTRSAPTFADVDGDTDLDLISGDQDGEFYFFENNNGIFTPQTGVANPFDGLDVGKRSTPFFIDLDGDNDLDLVSGEQNGGFMYFQNNGGVFTAMTGLNNPFNTISASGNSTTFFGDIDNDGDKDLLSGQYFGRFLLFESNNGIYHSEKKETNPFGGYKIETGLSSPTFADLDGDNDLDLISGETYGDFKYYLNNNGFFEEQLGVNNPFDGLDVFVSSTPTFVDIDGDTDLDLVSGEYLGTIKYYKNNSGVFAEQTGVNNPFEGIDVGDYSAPFFVDIDGDTDLDLVSGEETGSFKYYQNNNGVYTEKTGVDNPFSALDVGEYSVPFFVDIDADNDLDLVSGEYGGTFKYYQNDNGVYTEQSGINNPFDGIDVGSNSYPTFVNWHGSGQLDLITGNVDGEFRAFETSVITGLTSQLKYNKEQLTLYPNPVQSSAKLNKGGDYQILNTLGMQIGSFIAADEKLIDFSSLRPGIYFITSNQGVVRMLKQ